MNDILQILLGMLFMAYLAGALTVLLIWWVMEKRRMR